MAAGARMPLTITLLGRPAIARDGMRRAPRRAAARRGACWRTCCSAERPRGAARAGRPSSSPRPTTRSARCGGAWPSCAARSACRRRSAATRRVLALPAGRRGGRRCDVAAVGERAGGELLEGLSFASSPGFDAWLLVERRRLAVGLGGAAARGGPGRSSPRAARRRPGLRLARGRAQPARRVPPRAAGAQRSRSAATAPPRWHQAERCDEMLRRELGVPPSPAVRRAAYAADPPPGPPPSGGRAAARGAARGRQGGRGGRARSSPPSSACGGRAPRPRRAATRSCGRGRSSRSGTTLIHAVRGRDEEGAAVLHQAIAVAERAGDRASERRRAPRAGLRQRAGGPCASAAERWLAAAEAMAEGDAELAAVHGVQGMDLSDTRRLRPGARAPGRVGGPRRGRRRPAPGGVVAIADRAASTCCAATTPRRSTALDRCIALVEAERWVAFRPWPETLRAELAAARRRRRRRRRAARARLQRGLPGRRPVLGGRCRRAAIGLLEAGRGRRDEARRWLAEAFDPLHARARPLRLGARLRARRARGVAVRGGRRGGARAGATSCSTLAARTGMRELVVRAQVHLGRLGVDGMLDSARLLAAEIDNPLLAGLARAS